MAEKGWAGMVTNASPYMLPPGAAVEQTNLVTYVPGQLTSRGGMQKVSDNTGVDILPYLDNGTVKLLALAPTLLDSGLYMVTVSNETALSAPVAQTLSPTSGQVQSNYVGQFYAYGGEPPA